VKCDTKTAASYAQKSKENDDPRIICKESRPQAPNSPNTQ
jgi:hypothetical protein